jgi:hypothetical protein
VASCYACKGRLVIFSMESDNQLVSHLLVELNVVHDLESERKIPKVDMDPQKPDDAEVAKHPVERTLSIFTHDVTVTAS